MKLTPPASGLMTVRHELQLLRLLPPPPLHSQKLARSQTRLLLWRRLGGRAVQLIVGVVLEVVVGPPARRQLPVVRERLSRPPQPLGQAQVQARRSFRPLHNRLAAAALPSSVQVCNQICKRPPTTTTSLLPPDTGSCVLEKKKTKRKKCRMTR